MTEFKSPCLEQPLQKLNSAHFDTTPEYESSSSEDPIVQAITNLAPGLRKKILSKAWADVAAVVNEYAQSTGIGQRVKCSGDSDDDWAKLNKAVKKLPPNEEKEKVVTAFYEAIIATLKEEKSPV
jgi:hypothetical protein